MGKLINRLLIKNEESVNGLITKETIFRLKQEYLDYIHLSQNWIRVCRKLPLSVHVKWSASFVGKNILFGDYIQIEDFVHIYIGDLSAEENVNIGHNCSIRRGVQIYTWTAFVTIGNYCSQNT